MNDAIIVWLMLLVIAAVLLAIKAAEFFKNFNRETRYIKSEKRRAADYGEYRYWRRELRCHYLCLLPFVNEGNVLKLYNLFYHRKGARKKENNSSVLCIVAPSFIGIFISVVCICGASWAWFTATTANNTAKIKTAQYTVEVSAKTGENDADVTDDGGVFKAAVLRGNKYTVTITPNGTAENGYCIVEFENKKYYTEQLSNGSTIEFSATAGINGNITIQPMWGTCAVRNDDNTLKNEMDLTPIQNSLSAGVGTKNNDDKTVQHSRSTDKSVTESTAQSSQSSAKKTENEKQKTQSEINSADTFAKAVKNKSEESLTSSTAVVSQ